MGRAGLEAHPAVPTKQDLTSYCLVRNNINPSSKIRGWRTVRVDLNGHPGLSVVAE